jgi:hypothetical protein
VAKYVTMLRSGGDPVRYRLRDTEALTTLQIEFQEAMTGGRAKTVITLDENGNQQQMLINGRQLFGVILTEE